MTLAIAAHAESPAAGARPSAKGHARRRRACRTPPLVRAAFAAACSAAVPVKSVARSGEAQGPRLGSRTPATRQAPPIHRALRDAPSAREPWRRRWRLPYSGHGVLVAGCAPMTARSVSSRSRSASKVDAAPAHALGAVGVHVTGEVRHRDEARVGDHQVRGDRRRRTVHPFSRRRQKSSGRRRACRPRERCERSSIARRPSSRRC
jgi:hypothetical protein